MFDIVFISSVQAQVSSNFISIYDSAISISRILTVVIVILLALTMIWFVYNIIRMVRDEDSSKNSDNKKRVVWSVIAIAVLVSLWGLVAFLQEATIGSGKSGAVGKFGFNFDIPKVITGGSVTDGHRGGVTGGRSGDVTGGRSGDVTGGRSGDVTGGRKYGPR